MNKVPGIWKWTVVILFILNLALLATIWFKPSARYAADRMRPEQPNELIERNLHFTDQQVSEFDILRERHHDSIMMLQRQGQQLRKEYFDNLKHPETADSATLQTLVDAIGENQEQIEFVTFRHFRQVRALCDDKQKETFDKIINDVLRIMSRQHKMERRGDQIPGRQGPPPPGRQGPPPPPPGQ